MAEPIPDSVPGVRVARLPDLEQVAVAGVTWRPLRRPLGVTAFGVNAYSAAAPGQQLIEEHDETGTGSGRHEELYVVLAGRARFELDGTPLDAPVGTFIFVHEPSVRRAAFAAEPDTSVMVVGGKGGAALPVSPWEHYFAAEPAYQAGDYERAIEIVSEGLEDYPEHGTIHYQLACYHAMAGNREAALRHLAVAVERDPRTRGYAATDADLDAIRDDERFPREGG